MNNNIREEDKNIQFLEGLNSKLAVKRDYENKTLNSKWIDMFEEVIPYIDNILRNPKRFIINEEEIRVLCVRCNVSLAELARRLGKSPLPKDMQKLRRIKFQRKWIS